MTPTDEDTALAAEPPVGEPAPGGDDFHETLRTRTPRVLVTPLLVVANLAVFGAMLFFGVSPLTPEVDDLIRWGGNYAPRTTDGEWWRLSTSMFVHIGVVHLLFNMIVLAQVGPFTERLFGTAGFVCVYVVSGLAGSLASVATSPATVSAGASGAIFGLYGALLAFLFREGRRSIPPATAKKLINGALVFVGFNVLYGLGKTGIDMAAHLGGIAGGLVLGAMLARPLTPEATTGRTQRATVAGIVGLGLLAAGASAVPHVGDVLAAIERFAPVEDRVIDDYNATLERWKKDELSAAQFATKIEKDVLPPWRQAKADFESTKDVPANLAAVNERLLRVIRLREEGWTMLVEGLRAEDWDKVKAAFAKHEAADASS